MDTNDNDSLTKQASQTESPQEEPATQLSQASKQQDTMTKLSKKKGGRGWLIAAISLLVAAAIGGGIYYFLNQKDSRPHHDADEDDEDEIEMTDDEDDEDMDEDDSFVIGRDDPDDEDADDEADTPATDPNAPKPLKLTGDADGYPLTLTLEVSADGRVKGTYKNDTEETTIQVTGTQSGNAIYLTGNANRTTYTFRIAPEGRLYTGTIETGSKTMELHLTAQ